MYTIRGVSQRVGVTPTTLRAWEQRYGVVSPARSEGGYRHYDEADVAALEEMARLVSSGMQPSLAAELVREERSSPHPLPVRSADEPSESSRGLPPESSLVAAATTFDVQGLEDTLDAAFGAAGFEHVIDRWLTPALREVGDAWAAGRLNVAQEHFISAAVMRRLAAAFAAAGQSRVGRHVLVGLVPGAVHEIAILAFATMLRRAGLHVTYLGTDLPVENWVDAVRETRPDAVVLGAPLVKDAEPATRVVQALHDATPEIPVYVGGTGQGSGQSMKGASLTQAVDWLVTEMTDTRQTNQPKIARSGQNDGLNIEPVERIVSGWIRVSETQPPGGHSRPAKPRRPASSAAVLLSVPRSTKE